MATSMLLQTTHQLKALMRAVVDRIDAAKRGEQVQHFDRNQLTALLCCIGDSLIENRLAMHSR